MKINVSEGHNIVLEEIYNPLKMLTRSGEYLIVQMRDSGFEINYNGKNYNLQKGDLKDISERKKPGKSLLDRMVEINYKESPKKSTEEVDNITCCCGSTVKDEELDFEDLEDGEAIGHTASFICSECNTRYHWSEWGPGSFHNLRVSLREYFRDQCI